MTAKKKSSAPNSNNSNHSSRPPSGSLAPTSFSNATSSRLSPKAAATTKLKSTSPSALSGRSPSSGLDGFVLPPLPGLGALPALPPPTTADPSGATSGEQVIPKLEESDNAAESSVTDPVVVEGPIADSLDPLRSQAAGPKEEDTKADSAVEPADVGEATGQAVDESLAGERQGDEATPREPSREASPEPPVPAKRSRGARAAAAGANGKLLLEAEPEPEDEEELVMHPVHGDEEEDDGVTRCVCDEDNDELSSGLMIECEECKCWQHGPCVGLWDEKECPDTYYCELCKPSWHGPGGVLRKSHRKHVAPTATHRRSPPVPTSRNVGKGRGAAASAADEDVHDETRTPSPAAQNAVSTSAASGATSARNAGVSGNAGAAKKNSIVPEVSASLGPPAKKRSTMNSRDAAYDDAIALSLLEANGGVARPKSEKSGSKKGASEGGGPASANQSQEPEDEDEDERDTKRSESASKRRRLSNERADEDDAMAVDHAESVREPTPPPVAPPVRAKHPNQYTYRPKNGAAAGSTARSRASPTKRSTKDSGSGNAGKDRDPTYGGASGHANGNGGGAGSTGANSAVDNLARSQRARDWTSPQEAGSWGMPDHLRHLQHLLPTPSPQPLLVSSSMSSNQAAAVASSNAAATAAWEQQQSYEQPTRVRFPNKRMTMPEMKKRARNVLDYLDKVQVEMGERERRVELLGLSAGLDHQSGRSQTQTKGKGKSKGKGTSTGAVDYSATSQALEALTNELQSFHSTFFGNE